MDVSSRSGDGRAQGAQREPVARMQAGWFWTIFGAGAEIAGAEDDGGKLPRRH